MDSPPTSDSARCSCAWLGVTRGYPGPAGSSRARRLRRSALAIDIARAGRSFQPMVIARHGWLVGTKGEIAEAVGRPGAGPENRQLGVLAPQPFDRVPEGIHVLAENQIA